MEVGIVGLPGSGKTTLFNALTAAAATGFSEKPNVGVANIPDPRLKLIAEFIPPEKIVPATIRLVDIPGVASGGSAGGNSGGYSGGGGEARKLNVFLEHVRQVDASCQVVRCFDDGTGKINPIRDIEQMQSELVLADLVVAESAADKAARTARTGEKDAKERVALLQKIMPEMEEGKPIRAMGEFSEREHSILRSYGFISSKPVLYVANISEDAVAGVCPHAEKVRTHAEEAGTTSVALCANLEAELSELEEGDRDEMLESLGLAEPAVGPLARAAQSILGLTSFYTAGPKEVRAWTVHQNATAPEAAGAVHSDIQRGFIRAECYSVDDLLAHKSEKAIKDAGKLRSEGKGYQIRDGDVMHFLFNV